MEWKRISEERVYNGFRKVDRRYFELPSKNVIDIEVFPSTGAVCVVPLTPDQNVILAKQFRPGPEKVLLELPGGALGKDEDPLDAAKREFLEETGYSGDFQFVGTTIIDSYSTGIRHNYVATNCVKVAEPMDDPREPIELVLLSLAEFREHLRTGQLSDTATGYLGLDYLKLL